MSASSDAVFHRRNKQIQDAIDGQNLKQALQLCEKRIKKGEDTRFLRAWKAHILFRHADEAHHQRGIAETLEICNLDPPTTDLDTLDILHQTLRRLDGHEATARALWEKAAKAKPQDLEVQMRWFTYAFEDGDWKAAQKAAMSLQNNFPKSRKYYFWAIFLCYLVAVDPASSDADRKLFGTLAYRMISKAADSVPSDPKELLSPPRAIQTSEELLLLIKIFELQGRHVEVLSILDSENLGITSRIVQNDWSFVRAKLHSLEKAEKWAEGLAFAKSLLGTSDEAALKERDDWAVWSLMLSAIQKIDSPDAVQDVQTFIEEFIERQPKSRNAQLARLDMVHWRVQSGAQTADDLLSACQLYFDRNSNRLYCFEDLQKYLVALGKDLVSKFLDHVSSHVDEQSSGKDANDPFKGVAKINALKLEYCFKLSSDDSSVSREQVEDFVSRCLQEYRSTARPSQSESPSTIESQPSDDLCLIAAMSLIRFDAVASQGKAPSPVLIRAAGVLEHLLRNSPHNYHALLLLVRIYLLLGAGSLALKTFSKLNVKQMQFETVAHNLFTRLSTVHPHSAPPIEGADFKDFDPQTALVVALTFYRNADITTTRSRTSGLDYGSYVNIEGSIELQKRLRQSICRRMWALDVRRMQRLVGGDPMGRYDDLVRDPLPVIDRRTFDGFMNCEAPGTATFEERMRLGPLPREHWVKSSTVTDRLFTLLKNMAVQKPTGPEADLPTIEELTGSASESDMTSVEIDNTKLHLALLKIASLLNGSKSVPAEELDGLLTQVEEWLTSTSQTLSSENSQNPAIFSETAVSLQAEKPSALPSWLYLHHSFSVLETLKAVSLLVSVSARKTSKSTPKIAKDRADRLVTLVRQIHDAIKTNTRALKSRVQEPGVLSALVDLVVAGDGEQGGKLREVLESMLDTAALEVFCGALMESWEEGLDGVLAVTV
ncbi:cytoskeleton organization protein [Thermoascus aurantiacus ATCC 26904]